jgi:hypothetical protein
MVCVEHETLRREWIAARAAYQLALADLQVSSGVDEFRETLKRANEAFADFYEAERGLDAHLKWHDCARVSALRPVPRAVGRASL